MIERHLNAKLQIFKQLELMKLLVPDCNIFRLRQTLQRSLASFRASNIVSDVVKVDYTQNISFIKLRGTLTLPIGTVWVQGAFANLI